VVRQGPTRQIVLYAEQQPFLCFGLLGVGILASTTREKREETQTERKGTISPSAACMATMRVSSKSNVRMLSKHLGRWRWTYFGSGRVEGIKTRKRLGGKVHAKLMEKAQSVALPYFRSCLKTYFACRLLAPTCISWPARGRWKAVNDRICFPRNTCIVFVEKDGP